MAKALSLLVVLAAALALLPSSGHAQKTPKKLAKQDVIDLLTGDVPSDQVADVAKKSGISFDVTAAVETEIRNAGGTDALIRVLKSLSPHTTFAPAPAPPRPHPTGAAGPAVLMIESSPGQSQVYIDDEPVGTTSPEGRLKLTRFSAGDHRVRVSLSGYQDFERSITLTAGQSTTVEATLQAAQSAHLIPSPQTPPQPEPQPQPANPGQPGFLGVEAMQQQPAGARGVAISGAIPGTPAEQAGLKPYDVIFAINGRRVATLNDIHNALQGHTAGEVVQLTWYNGAQTVTKPVQLVPASAAGQAQTQPATPPSLTNMPHNGFVTFLVGHDHGQSAKAYCKGTMSIGNGMIYYRGNYANDGAVHNYEIPLSTVREARRNTVYLMAIGAFHIKLKKGTNYNFVVLNQNGQYQPPDALLTAIDNAMGR